MKGQGYGELTDCHVYVIARLASLECTRGQGHGELGDSHTGIPMSAQFDELVQWPDSLLHTHSAALYCIQK